MAPATHSQNGCYEPEESIRILPPEESDLSGQSNPTCRMSMCVAIGQYCEIMQI